MALGTESFNEINVQNDFKHVMDAAQKVRAALNKGTEDIDAVIGNNSMNDAYSGQAAASVKNQWYGLADTIESFLQNFQNWYDQSVEVSKANQALQSSTSNVQIES